MKPILLPVLIVIILSACTSNKKETPNVETGLFEESMTIQDSLRSYLLYVPDSYTGEHPLPLLLTFHGYTSSAKRIMNYSGYNQLADSLGFIVVYPQGTMLKGNTHWNVGGWTLESPVDDVSFVNALLDSLSSAYNIDEQRIYANGMSNGGYMSFLLACQPNNRIAAIASITGAMTPQTLESCTPDKHVPVLQIHADTDDTVPYAGDRSWTIGIPEILDFWVANNNASTKAEITALENTDPDDGSTVEKHVYFAESTNAPVIHYYVKGGGHDWPGAWGNKDFSASETTWEFLSEFY